MFRNNFVTELRTIDYLLYLNDSGDGSNDWVLDTQKGAVFKKNETADNKISKYRELQEKKNEYANDAIF